MVRLSGVQSNCGGAALQMAVAGAAALLPDGAPLWVCGLEEEGICDASVVLRGLFTEVQELARDGGARVLRGWRCAATHARPLAEFSSFARLPLGEVGLADVDRWRVWPGLFAGGTLDVMTAFLLRRLQKVSVEHGARIMDFCCGSGAIACAVLQRQPQAELHLADADALAVEAARQNVTDRAASAHCHLGDGWESVPTGLRFDWIISNPPVHRRRQDDFSVVEELVAGATERLRGEYGRLWIVAQVHVPVGPLLECHGFHASADSDGRFVLWRARPVRKQLRKRGRSAS